MTVTESFCLDRKIAPTPATDSDSKSKKLLCKAKILSSYATYDNEYGTSGPTEIALILCGNESGIDSTALQSKQKGG